MTNGNAWQGTFTDAATQQNVTWELVFRPGDFEGSHVLLSLGGNSGGALGITAITLIGSILDFRFQDANNEAQRVSVSTDLALTGASDGFLPRGGSR